MRAAERLRSASGDTTTGFLPPSSSVTGTVARRGLLHQCTDRRRTGKEQMVERQRREGRRDLGPAGDDIEFGWVEVLRRRRLHQVRGLRSDLRHLDHHPVACRKRGRGGQHDEVEREIPRTDDSDNTQWRGLDLGFQAEQSPGPHQLGRPHPLRHMRSGVLNHRDHAEDFGEQRSRLRPGAVIGRHGVDERIGVVQDEREQPVDAVAPRGHAGWAFGHERLPLTLKDRAHSVPVTVDRAVDPFLRCAHSSVPYSLSCGPEQFTVVLTVGHSMVRRQRGAAGRIGCR